MDSRAKAKAVAEKVKGDIQHLGRPFIEDNLRIGVEVSPDNGYYLAKVEFDKIQWEYRIRPTVNYIEKLVGVGVTAIAALKNLDQEITRAIETGRI